MVQDVKKGGAFLINCQWSDEELDKHLHADAKRYIAENNIKVYTVDAVDIAGKIGLGKRTSTVLQSAFFKLANVLPTEEAVTYMKEKVVAKFSKKGQDIVDMNCKAIDAGCDALHEVKVPASWATAQDNAADVALVGEPKTVKMVKNLMQPINLMKGDDLPVSAFMEYSDGQFETGASAYEKRGTAVMVPQWTADKCIQCNNCAYVCSHATIRPFLLSEEEVKAAPSIIKTAELKPKAGKYKYTLSISALDCMGCSECITVCPTGAIEMVLQEAELPQQPVWDYLVANVSKKEDAGINELTAKGVQFNQPLLEFSGACAGCAETAYARLATQLFGEEMYVANATGCSSIWGGPAATSPYTINKLSKRGVAWSNSLFEDNAEYGLGIEIAQKYIRNGLITKLEAMAQDASIPASLKDAIAKFMETKDNTRANSIPARVLIAELEKYNSDAAKEILVNKDYLSKKSIWILGGDGWAYDIGFGGLDHVIASGENVNILVFDTEMYSNTGGQASKASNIGEICQFAAAGKEVGKKSLAEIAMSYGYVYVAHVALSANPAQAVKAFVEAEAYNGPSLIIAYAPCEIHGIKGGMKNCQETMKEAVKSGYWNVFSYNPALKAEGKNPFTLSSKEGDGTYQEFLNKETRYSALTRKFPERAEYLFKKSEDTAKERFKHLQKLVDLYSVSEE